MRGISKQRLQWVTGLFLALPVVFFYLGQYFNSEAFLSKYRLVSFLQNRGLQAIAVLLVVSFFIAVLYYLWNTLASWTTGQKIVSSVLLFVYPLIVFVILSLVHFDLKLWEPKEYELTTEQVPNSTKHLHVLVEESTGFLSKNRHFNKTILCTHHFFSPVMTIIGEYECPVSNVVKQSSSLKVEFENGPITEEDSAGCKSIMVY